MAGPGLQPGVDNNHVQQQLCRTKDTLIVLTTVHFDFYHFVGHLLAIISSI